MYFFISSIHFPAAEHPYTHQMTVAGTHCTKMNKYNCKCTDDVTYCFCVYVCVVISKELTLQCRQSLHRGNVIKPENL